MADATLNIVLKLLDQATADIKKAFDETSKSSGETAKKQKENSEQMTKNALKLTLTIGGLVKAYRMVDQAIKDVIRVGLDMDSSFNASWQNFQLSILKVEQSIAKKIIPVIQTALDFWTKFLDKTSEEKNPFDKQIIEAQNYLNQLVALKSQHEQMIESSKVHTSIYPKEYIENAKKEVLQYEAEIKRAMNEAASLRRMKENQPKEASKSEENIQFLKAKLELEALNKELEKHKVLFLSGKESADQYYQSIIDNEVMALQLRQQAAQQMQQLAVLTQEINNRQYLDAQRQNQEQIEFLNEYKTNFMAAHAGMISMVTTLSRTIRTGLSSALSDIITGAKSAKEAFAEFGRSIVKAIVDFMVQKVIAFALEKVLLAGHLARSIATAGAIAAAWAPAATAVNIASFGAAGMAAASSAMVAGAATSGAMALSSTGVAATRGIEVSVQSALGTAGPGFAEGITKVPYDMTARIHKNEMIIPSGFAEDIRRGELTIGNSGGNINVNVYYPKMSSKEEVETLARALGFEIEKQMRYARTI